MDRVEKIMAYEMGELEDREAITLFSDIIKDGTVWSLQGHYGRVASQLIEQGLISEDGEVNEEMLLEMLAEQEN